MKSTKKATQRERERLVISKPQDSTLSIADPLSLCKQEPKLATNDYGYRNIMGIKLSRV